MRLCIVALVVFAILVGLTLVAHLYLQANYNRVIIRFPQPWVKKREGKERVVNDNVQYVIRQSARRVEIYSQARVCRKAVW
jgi:hypothetical protein